MPSTGSLRLTAVTRREVQLWLVRFSNRERIEDLTALLFCTLLLTVPEVFAQGVQLPDCTSLEAAQTETERSYDELIRKTNADFEEIKRNAFLAGLGASTRSGSFGESLGNANGKVAEAQEHQLQIIAQLKMQKEAALRDLSTRPCARSAPDSWQARVEKLRMRLGSGNIARYPMSLFPISASSDESLGKEFLSVSAPLSQTLVGEVEKTNTWWIEAGLLNIYLRNPNRDDLTSVVIALYPSSCADANTIPATLALLQFRQPLPPLSEAIYSEVLPSDSLGDVLRHSHCAIVTSAFSRR